MPLSEIPEVSINIESTNFYLKIENRTMIFYKINFVYQLGTITFKNLMLINYTAKVYM